MLGGKRPVFLIAAGSSGAKFVGCYTLGRTGWRFGQAGTLVLREDLRRDRSGHSNPRPSQDLCRGTAAPQATGSPQGREPPCRAGRNLWPVGRQRRGQNDNAARGIEPARRRARRGPRSRAPTAAPTARRSPARPSRAASPPRGRRGTGSSWRGRAPISRRQEC